MATFIIGDIHGNLKGLQQCLERSSFDFEKDKLILVGDLVDGYPDTKQLIDLLLTIKNLVFVRGNHDDWFINWLQTGDVKNIWYTQGGKATLLSYMDNDEEFKVDLIPKAHKEFFFNSKFWYEEKDFLVIHGGFNQKFLSLEEAKDDLCWDRDMISGAVINTYYTVRTTNNLSKKPLNLIPYKEVYVGHTCTFNWPNTKKVFDVTKPFFCTGYKDLLIVNMDTGGGYPLGYLTMMNVDTKEIFQAEQSKILYPNYLFTRD